MNNDRLLRLRRLSNVPRWAVIPTIRHQSVAEHSFHVCALALWLADRSAAVAEGSVTRADIMHAAMYHDESETMTGDIAAPAKKWMDKTQFTYLSSRLGIGEYETQEIKSIIKVADLMEAFVFLHEESYLGNNTVWGIMDDIAANLVLAWSNFRYADNDKPTATDVIQELLLVLRADKHPCLEHI